MDMSPCWDFLTCGDDVLQHTRLVHQSDLADGPMVFWTRGEKKESRSQGREKDNKKLGEKKQVDQSWTDCFEVNELKKIFF